MLDSLKTICKNATMVNRMLNTNPILLRMSGHYFANDIADYIDAINNFIADIEKFNETSQQCEYLVEQLNNINTEDLPINYAINHLRNHFTNILNAINNINNLKS